MSSADAAHTETITIVESPSVASQSISPPTSPSRHDPCSPGVAANVDGRTNDADKMLQSSGLDLGEGDFAPDAAGPSSLDASQQQGMEVTSGASDDPQQWPEEEGHELKRVKVYELDGSRWVDKGTAFCFGDVNQLQDHALLVARAEEDFSRIILQTLIRSSDVYQRQQETLIVWTEPSGVDYALSFQDPDGCEEVWNFIQEVQRHISTQDPGLSSSPMIGPEPSINAAAILRVGHLPAPALGTIPDIEKLLKSLARAPNFKEHISDYIQEEEYVRALIDVFKQAEDLESIDNLHALCTCMQTILLLNEHSMYDYILKDEVFRGVVGMLEYDPEFPAYKANYRDFLRDTSHFHQPIPIKDETIRRKIHHTYRLQYLKDVVLARVLDDSTFNVLNSCILFNQIDIINHIQSDPTFLLQVISVFVDEDTIPPLVPKSKDSDPSKLDEEKNKMDVDQSEPKTNNSASSISNSGTKPPLTAIEFTRRREVISLIQQLCIMGKNIQLPARLALFRNLCDRGILHAVQWALAQSENTSDGLSMISAGGEILSAILDHDVNGVRTQVMRQVQFLEGEGSNKAAGKKPQAETLLALLCRVVVRSRNLAVQSLVAEALRVLLEVSQGDASDSHPVMSARMLQRPKDDPVTEKFIEHFYKHCADVLFTPLMDVPEFKNNEGTLSSSRERINLYLHLCELLANFALQHSFRSHFYMLSSNIASHVGTLLSARDKHLRLAAFRFFRVLLRLNNRNLFNHLMKIDAMKPVLDLTIRESRRDNLLSSTCKEFFEYIRKENMKDLLHHCMTKHADEVKILLNCELTRPCFQVFAARWEMNMEPPPKDEQRVEKSVVTPGARRWGQGKLLEAEEENYFNSPDDEDDSATYAKTNAHAPFKRRRVRTSGPMRPQQQQQPQRPPIQRTASLGSLVDYDDGEDTNVAGPTNDAQLTSAVFSMPPRISGSPNPQQMPPSSPRLPYRNVSPKPPSPGPTFSTQSPQAAITNSQPEFSHTLFEQYMSGMTAQSPGKAGGSPPGEFIGAKRRREEDDEDELLERLVSPKTKRPGGAQLSSSPGQPNEQASPGGASGISIKIGGMKSQEESGGARKIKLKLSSPSLSTPSPSSTGVKDGDTG